MDRETALRELSQGNPDLQRRAARVLGRWDDDQVLAALIAALQSPHRGIREAAADTLLEIGDGRAVRHLLPLLRNSPPAIRNAARLILQRRPLRLLPQAERQGTGAVGLEAADRVEDFLFPLLDTARRGYGGNNAYYSNPQVDRLLDRASITTNQSLRKSLYWQVQEIFAQDYVHIPLFFKPSILGTSKRVEGLKVDPLGYFRLKTEEATVWMTP